MCLCTLCLLLWTLPVWSAEVPPQGTVLTSELLQARLEKPILREGNLVVDLQQMVIDLRPENASFRDTFYQLLRKELQKSGTKPLGLDLSHSTILGDFVGSDLGLRTPLYAQAIAPIFTPSEQEQLERLRGVCLQSLAIAFPSSKDCQSLLATSKTSNEISVFRGSLNLSQTHFYGTVQFANTFFLQSVEAEGAIFEEQVNFSETRFSRVVSFLGANFQRESQFSGSIFFDRTNFKQTKFQDVASFQDSVFEGSINFLQAHFQQIAQFNRVQWQENTDFSQAQFSQEVQFNQAIFNQFLSFTEAKFKEIITFQGAQFNQKVNLRGANIQKQVDFSDARFAKEADLNVSGLIFNSNQAKILGNPGQIGKKLVLSTLEGNQSVLRNLGQNFRQLQQIADANQLEYTKQRLRLEELSRLLIGTNINSVSQQRLINLGFSPTQAQVIIHRRWAKPFRSKSELLTLPEIDLETYAQLYPFLVVGEPLSLFGSLLQGWSWLALSLLLLLSGYGTNFGLVFGVGMIAIAYFGLLFWIIDRFRRLHPLPIVPRGGETAWMLVSFSFFVLFGFLGIFHNGEQPWLTLGCLLLILLPIPAFLLFRLYYQGRYHDLMDVSYFTEDGTMRQLRLLIGRLPVIPRYQMFRERYLPLLWDRRWNWLNYYDFSLNNLLRLGFNDIRLRDEHLPSLITTLVWYQWSLGILYITLLLWTLSRTIPGLNLLIYLK